MSDLSRIDPSGCGCTDCQTGYSKPLDQCNSGDLMLLIVGVLQNASACEPEIFIDGKMVMSLKGYKGIMAYFAGKKSEASGE